MFLLGNIETVGLRLGASFNSGNFKFIHRDGDLIGVCCLTRRGNLLIQTLDLGNDSGADQAILDACLEENLPIRGVIGEWGVAHRLWDYFVRREVIRAEGALVSKEVIYTRDLSRLPPAHPMNNIRLLDDADFSQWKSLRIAMLEELSFPDGLSKEQVHSNYLKSASQRLLWGLFDCGDLVSIANLNARVLDLAQVAGVFTTPEKRRLGYSRRVMQKVMADSRNLHNVRKLNLFTGEQNHAARAMYESLDFVSGGYFGLCLGKDQ